MSIGKRNRLVTIQRRESQTDASNFPIDSWVIHKKKWVEFAGQTGMGSVRSGATNGTGIAGTQNIYSLRGSYDTSITQDMRVEYRGSYFEIKEVRHDIARRQYSDIVVIANGGLA